MRPSPEAKPREAIVTGVDDARKRLTSLGRKAREQVGDWVASGKKIVVGTKREVNAAIDAGREAIHDATAEKRS